MKLYDFSNRGFVLYVTTSRHYFVGYAKFFKDFIHDARFCYDSEIVLIASPNLYSTKKRLTITMVKYILSNVILSLTVLYKKEKLFSYESLSTLSEIYSMGKNILTNTGGNLN